jgi:CRISPR/Cas system-associated exonuclease Cas4 (RecB family)
VNYDTISLGGDRRSKMTNKMKEGNEKNESAWNVNDTQAQSLGMSEVGSFVGYGGELTRSHLVDEVGDDGLIVPVTALSLFVEDPVVAKSRFVGGINIAPTPALLAGKLEHLARELAFNELRKVYLEAEKDDDLRASYDALIGSVEQASMECERKYGSWNLNIKTTADEILNRLRIEEDARVAAAGNLMKEGIRGFDLVCLLLPVASEFPIRSENLGLEGRIDAIYGTNVGRFPLDYKTGSRTNWVIRASEKIQIAAYCMLIEDYYGMPCNYAEIYYSRYFHNVPIFVSKALKDRVLEIRRMFIENSVTDEIPRRFST